MTAEFQAIALVFAQSIALFRAQQIGPDRSLPMFKAYIDASVNVYLAQLDDADRRAFIEQEQACKVYVDNVFTEAEKILINRRDDVHRIAAAIENIGAEVANMTQHVGKSHRE